MTDVSAGLPSAAAGAVAAKLSRESEVFRDLYQRALKHLGRREHARAELAKKLQSPNPDAETLESVLDFLEEVGFLDEARFAAAFIEDRLRRAQGPDKIRAELQTRGVGDALIDQALRDAAADWTEIAKRAHARKFSSAVVASLPEPERRRRVRHLLGRGFAPETVARALDIDLNETA